MRQVKVAPMVRPSVRTIGIAMLVIAAGCCSDGGEYRQPQRGELERSLSSVAPGSTKQEVFAALPQQGHRERLSVTTLDDSTLEEWQIRDAWSLFIELSGATEHEESGRRYLYFIDDRLLQSSGERLNEQQRRRLFDRVQPLPSH